MYLKNTGTVIFLLGLGLLAFLGGWLTWFSTPYGVGIYYDSLEYVAAAKNLIAGYGLGRLTCSSFEPMIHYPPLYSLVLSVFEIVGIAAIRGARLISIAGMIVSVIISGLLTLKACGNKFFALLVAFLLCISPVMLNGFTWAMSEPLYIPLMLISILFLTLYMENGNQAFFYLSAVFTSLSILSRYVGVSLVFSSVIIIFFHSKQNNKLRQIVKFLFISLFPISLWLLRNRALTSSVTNRALGWYLPSPERITTILNNILNWFLPYKVNRTWGWIGLAIIGLGLVFLFWMSAINRNVKTPIVFRIINANILCFVGILFSLMVFLDPTTPLDDRILLPLYVLVLMMVSIGISFSWMKNNFVFRFFAILFCFYLVIFQVGEGYQTIKNLRKDGQFYAALYWKNSQVSKILLDLMPQTIYTNDMTALYFGTYLPSCIIPLENKPQALTEFKNAITGNPDMVIVIYTATMNGFVSSELFKEDLQEIQFSEGFIYIH
jgi:hypothetical protein